LILSNGDIAVLHAAPAAISIEFACEMPEQTRGCRARLAVLGYRRFSLVFGESGVLHCAQPVPPAAIIRAISESPDPLARGDSYARRPDPK
jgi:hypothetical protein